MEYIKLESKPKDGRVLAIGHSMGGILLYAMISRCGKALDFHNSFSKFFLLYKNGDMTGISYGCHCTIKSWVWWELNERASPER